MISTIALKVGGAASSLSDSPEDMSTSCVQCTHSLDAYARRHASHNEDFVCELSDESLILNDLHRGGSGITRAFGVAMCLSVARHYRLLHFDSGR
jgi:hypothetical protein